MRSTELPIYCPYCTTQAVVDCETSHTATERTNRLRGTDVDCRGCGNEFELYYY
ncbi:hypothetical protein [Halalkalicoccus jeotgali]|uniref:Uncharacterized protein n=1 Tax=Halalkalicoccus jeotgali (strain DSM 18796 / CECT 7217 / JCM 14584 / KCTC 4019 / B3) TaxID=795797 RepID=D8J485_HALJB|nr:hypothetical protein [Halalkalicoccus jeotgali]ADJ15477.1 hypothetical protein HacjB3_10470 [Halalkalicoccus jeotgali B3]ELY36114.1 hypothetical protein C497_12197 [Halalkalicoccus jeotgali B3]